MVIEGDPPDLGWVAEREPATGPLLTVVVPVYRIERYVSQCLVSLAEQDLPVEACEIIIVDDGSTDGSSAIVEAWAEGRSNVRVHRQSNRGLGAARNVGLDLARGRYVWFVDGDDRIASDVLGTITASMESMDLTMLALGVARVAPDASPSADARTPTTAGRVTDGRTHLAGGRATAEAWGYVYRREFVLSEGLRFPEGQLIEDVVFTTTALIRAPRVAALRRTAYFYVQRSDSIMHLRGADHTRRIIEGFTAVVEGLDRLRRELEAEPAPPTALLAHLELRAQSYVFFSLARLVRSEIPFTPTFMTLTATFRALGQYPMTAFPGDLFPGLRYRVLTVILDRPWLARPFATVTRGAMRVLGRLRRA